MQAGHSWLMGNLRGGRIQGEGEKSCPIPEAAGFLETVRQTGGKFCFQAIPWQWPTSAGVAAWGHQIKPEPGVGCAVRRPLYSGRGG